MSEPAAEPTKRRSGWWFLAKLAVGLLVLMVGTLWFWVRSDGDLRTARERIAAAGFPTTGAEMGRKKSDEARIAASMRLDALFTNKTSPSGWPIKAVLGDGYNQPSHFAVPGTPLPETLFTYFAALPPAAVAEALALLDGLGDEPVVHEVPFTATTRLGVSSQAASFVFYSALISPTPDLEKSLLRCHRFATQLEQPSMRLQQWQGNVISRLMQVLLYWRTDLTLEQRQRFAGLVLELTNNPGQRLARAQAGSLVADLDFFLDPIDRSRRAGLLMHSLLEWPVVGAVYYRAGRGPLIQLELDWAIFLREHRDDLRVIVAESHRRQPTTKGDWTLLLDPSMLLTHLTSRMQYAPYWCEAAARTRLRAELVAAVLRDEPWPVDWFDPTGARLRPITIDGKVTGAYSVGSDGVDDGGTSNKDVRWALFGPIDQPKP